MVEGGPLGGPLLRRASRWPPAVRAALKSPGGRCYRHCDQPIRVHRVRSSLPGQWEVRACPSGVVSVTSYAEWTRRDPTAAVRRTLGRWVQPRSLLRSWDLRTATRHGPELGRAAERAMGRATPRRPVRVVYWRVYPSRAPDGSERRLFVCFRHARAGPVFFSASPTGLGWPCPACLRPRRRARGRDLAKSDGRARRRMTIDDITGLGSHGGDAVASKKQVQGLSTQSPRTS